LPSSRGTTTRVPMMDRLANLFPVDILIPFLELCGRKLHIFVALFKALLKLPFD